MQLVEESWRVAFRLLAEVGDSKKMGGVTMQDIDNWANSKVSLLNEHSAKLFNRMDSQKHGVDFSTILVCEFPSFQAVHHRFWLQRYNSLDRSNKSSHPIEPNSSLWAVILVEN
jgi:hypothetical protein